MASDFLLAARSSREAEAEGIKPAVCRKVSNGKECLCSNRSWQDVMLLAEEPVSLSSLSAEASRPNSG